MVDKTFATILETQPQPRSARAPPPLLPPANRNGNAPAAVSEAIVFLPVTAPVDALLSPDRAETISHVDVEAMNADLAARLGPAARAAPGSPAPPIRLPAVFNAMLVGTESETTDGLHWSPRIVRKQAEVLLGWRCNDAASTAGTLQGACCRRPDRVRPVQALVLAVAVGWAPAGMLLRAKKREWAESRPQVGDPSNADTLNFPLCSRFAGHPRLFPRPGGLHVDHHIRHDHRLPLPRGSHDRLSARAKAL